MNSLALCGELSGSLGSFLPCVPRQRLAVPGSLGAAPGVASLGNFSAAARSPALWSHSLNIVEKWAVNNEVLAALRASSPRLVALAVRQKLLLVRSRCL